MAWLLARRLWERYPSHWQRWHRVRSTRWRRDRVLMTGRTDYSTVGVGSLRYFTTQGPPPSRCRFALSVLAPGLSFVPPRPRGFMSTRPPVIRALPAPVRTGARQGYNNINGTGETNTLGAPRVPISASRRCADHHASPLGDSRGLEASRSFRPDQPPPPPSNGGATALTSWARTVRSADRREFRTQLRLLCRVSKVGSVRARAQRGP